MRVRKAHPALAVPPVTLQSPFQTGQAVPPTDQAVGRTSFEGTRRATPKANIELVTPFSVQLKSMGGNKTTRTHDKDAPLPSLHSSTTSDCGSPHLNSKIQPSPYQENHIYVQVEESDPFLQSVQCWAYKLFTSSLLQKKDRKTYPKTCCKKEKIL